MCLEYIDPYYIIEVQVKVWKSPGSFVYVS